MTINQAPTSGISALHMAATHGHLESVEKLIALGADVKFRDVFGKTPLICAKESRGAVRRQFDETGDRSYRETECKATAIIDLLRTHGGVE